MTCIAIVLIKFMIVKGHTIIVANYLEIGSRITQKYWICPALAIVLRSLSILTLQYVTTLHMYMYVMFQNIDWLHKWGCATSKKFNTLSMTLVGHATRFQAYESWFFTKFNGCLHMSAYMSRSGNLDNELMQQQQNWVLYTHSRSGIPVYYYPCTQE